MRMSSLLVLWALFWGGLSVACNGHDPNPTVADSECEQCHSLDYQSTVDPVHENVFPEKCVACHATTDWIPEDNQGHDKLFRIYSGSHRGIDCSECHLPPEEFFDFSCTDCHQHTESRTNSIHGGVGGYSYQSHRCLRCHGDRVE